MHSTWPIRLSKSYFNIYGTKDVAKWTLQIEWLWVWFPDQGLVFWVTFLVTWGGAYCLINTIITFHILGLELCDALECCTIWFAKVVKVTKSLGTAENKQLRIKQGEYSAFNLVQNTVTYFMHILCVCSIRISDLRLESNPGTRPTSHTLCRQRRGLITL